MSGSRQHPADLSEGSIRERAYLHIQRKIASGELPAGSSLSEPALARELGSSRTPIREALGQLVAEGLLEQTANRGAVVVQLTRQDIVDLYELREALELYAVAKVARQPVREADLQHLRQLVDETLTLKKQLDDAGTDSLNPRQMQRFVSIDLTFHALLMRLAANARILKIVNETRLLIRIFAMRHQGHSAADVQRVHDEHLAMLDAVGKQEPDRAVAILGAHIQNSRGERLAEYDFWERENAMRKSVPAFFDVLAPVERAVDSSATKSAARPKKRRA